MEPSRSFLRSYGLDPVYGLGPARSRLPDGWWRAWEDWMAVRLTCALGEGDANLGLHLEGEALEAQDGEGGGGGEDVGPLLSALSDPRWAAAVAEWADSVALRAVVSSGVPQSDLAALRRLWDGEFGRAAESFPGVPRVPAWAMMQVWSGCLAAAKALSTHNYWTGYVSPWSRYCVFRHMVFPECRRSALYRLGALAAPFFKAFRREPVSLDGVPLRPLGDRLGFGAWRGWVPAAAAFALPQDPRMLVGALYLVPPGS